MDSRKQRSILTVLFVGVLMGALDIAIVGPALPAIRSYFGVSERALSWIFSLYVLFNLIGSPLIAKFSDQFGRRSVYMGAVALFAIGSLIVAFAPSFELVLVGRAIQGFGAGGIFPVASAVVGDTFPPEKRGRALGLIGAVFGLAFLVGPLLGALILRLASWHWLFLINLPIAVIVILLSLRSLPASVPQDNRSFDWAGMAALAGLLASLTWGINHLDAQAFFGSLLSVNVLPFLAIFVLLTFVLIAIEKKASNPILPLGLFKRKQLRLAYILSAGAGFGEAGLVFIPLLAVVALNSGGVTEKNASWLLLPVVIAMAFGSPMAGRLLDRFGSRIVILVGTMISTLGMFLLGMFSTSLPMFLVSGALIGIGMSALLGAPLRYIMLNEARFSDRSIAQGVVAVFTSAGQLLGSALTGAIAASQTEASSAAAGYAMAFLVNGGVSLLLVAAAFLLKNRAAELETVRLNEAQVNEPAAPESPAGS